MNYTSAFVTVITVASLVGCSSTQPASKHYTEPTPIANGPMPAMASSANTMLSPVSVAPSPGPAPASVSRAKLVRDSIFAAKGLPPIFQEQQPRYQAQVRNDIVRVADQPVSTFSVDVDTGSYSNVRRHLQNGELPPRDAVRPEEMLNYFHYKFAKQGGDTPLALSTSVGVTPWNQETKLVRVSLDVPDVMHEQLPAANVVLLIDVSGSMSSPTRLPLIQRGLNMLVDKLKPEDVVSIVTYAGREAIALDGAKGHEKDRIKGVIDGLSAAGTTNGQSGVKAAYQLAKAHFVDKGVNRVLLATDGDFNVGMSDVKQVLEYVKNQKASGISLSTIGVGEQNYNEEMMEQLADAGDGNYSYIDTLLEAKKVLVDEFRSNWSEVARDVKVQVEFNPENVSTYRLIGYENRALKEQDLKNDKVDAGDVGLGHQVTALYEITLTKGKGERTRRYEPKHQHVSASHPNELAYVRLRYKEAPQFKPKEQSHLIEMRAIQAGLDSESKFAASVAAFAQSLSDGGKHLKDFSWDEISQLASENKGVDEDGYRGEFIRLIKLRKEIRQ